MPIFVNNTPLELAAAEATKACFDPEIPVNIYELGLIYEIAEKDAVVTVKMTLTSPNCPAAESLPSEVKSRILAIEGVKEAQVDIVFEPPWDKDMMSEEARLELGFW